MAKIVRTHDNFYAKELIKEPKTSFVLVGNLIESLDLKRGGGVADIGCAVGAFPNYLKGRFKYINVTGFEYSKELVGKAISLFPGIKFIPADITNSDDWVPYLNSFDIVTVLGVLSIFDDIDDSLQNIKKILKKDGKVFIHGMFNPYPLDVFIKYREAGSENMDLESGWNIISQKTVVNKLHDIGFHSIKFHPFKLDINLPRQEDPVRSWTEMLIDGERQIVNGLCIKQP